MAITKTTFTSTDATDSLQDLLTWLQANADDLFDGITLDSESSTLTCTVNGHKAVTFEKATNADAILTRIWLNNAASNPNYGSVAVVARDAYKTSKGIAIRFCSPSQPNSYYLISWLYVFRTNEGTIGACHCRPVSNSSGSLYCTFVDFERCLNFMNSFSSSRAYLINQAALTALTPVPLGDAGTVAEGLYITTFTELYDTVQWYNAIIDIGGTKYVYNGVIAFQE